MSDFERKLRAALHGVAEPAPPGLLAAVLRRHRRHKLRVFAGVLAVAAAVALAVTPVSAALRGTGRSPGGPGPAPATSSRASHPAAAPGTVLAGCDGANIGEIGRHWRAGATRAAGPLWFIDGGHTPGPRRTTPIRLYVAIAVLDGLRPGSAVVLKVAPGWRHDLRFLYGAGDEMTPHTQHLTRLAGRGELGVTFVACSPAQQIVPSRRFTDYYGGYLVRGARCVPVLVWLPGRPHPVTIRLGACPGR
jgi:hypothetical protein